MSSLTSSLISNIIDFYFGISDLLFGNPVMRRKSDEEKAETERETTVKTGNSDDISSGTNHYFFINFFFQLHISNIQFYSFRRKPR